MIPLSFWGVYSFFIQIFLLESKYDYKNEEDRHMLEKTRDYLTKLFKTAHHSILKTFRLFLPLFIAIFLIECILFTVFLSFQNNIALRNERVQKEYTHHLVISGLNEGEMLLLRNDERTVSRNDMCFDVIKTMKYDSAVYDATYTVYVKILSGNKNYGIFGLFIDDSLETNYETMCSRYADVLGTEEKPNERLSIEFTPLYTYEEDTAKTTRLCGASLLLSCLLSATFFYFLYCVYLSDKRFSFGIFSAFGASRHDLRTQAMAELCIAGTLLILPSYYVSSLLCYLLYRASDSSFAFSLFSLQSWLIILVCVLITLYVAVFFAMKTVTRAKPMELLSGDENTNTVSNVKRSFTLLKGRFPLLYEAISALRFRRHHITLTVVSAFLSVLFVLGFYFASVHSANISISKSAEPHFTLRFSNVSMLTEEYVSIFEKVTALESAYTRPQSSPAEDYAALLQIKEDNILSHNGLVHDEENALYYTSDACIYSGAFDTASYLSSMYRITGEPDRLFRKPQNILIGKTAQNSEAFSFNVGDTVTLAVAETDDEGNVLYLDEEATKISAVTGRSFWKEAYEKLSFKYYTFTVVGVIEDFPSGIHGTPIVIHPDMYKEITGELPTVNEMAFRVSNDASVKEFLDTESALRGIAARLGNCTLTTTTAFFEGQMSETYCYDTILRIVMILFLFFLPLIWFYSQALFFKKRENEFYILSAISAPLSRIRAIYLCNTLSVLPITVVSLLISLLASNAVFFLLEEYMPSVLGIGVQITSTIQLPSYVYIIGIAITVPSCLLSVLFSYFRYKKRYLSEKAANDFHDGE